MLKNIKPSFRKICCNFIIGAFFCTSFVSVANADICFVLDQDCIDGGALNRMTQENELCSGYNESYDISTSNNGLKCEPCKKDGMVKNKGGMVKYKCYCKEDTLERKGDRCVYKNDTVCPVADYYFDADRGAGWDCDACIDHWSEQYGKYKCNCDGDHLYKNGTCVEDACLFLKGKELVNNSTASSRENQNWVCQKCTASSSNSKYNNKAYCECDGEAWGEYCIPAGRCVASQGYYNTSNIQCGTGDVVKRMDSGHYKGCYYCADDDSDKCPSPYTKRQEEACRGKNGWYTIETDVTSTKGYPCFTCRQYQCNEEEGYYYFESQCKKHYNISWMDNFDRMWAAVVNNLIPIKDALAAVSQKAINAQNLQLVNDGVGGYIVAVGGGTGGRDCPCPKSGPGSGQYYGKDSSGRDMYYDLSPCCKAITEQPITNDGLRPFVDGILDNERVLDEVIYREYRCFEDSTTKCWYGKIINTDVCPEGTDFFAKLTCGNNEEKVDSGQTSAKSHTKCYRCQRRVYVYNIATETCAPYLYLKKSDGTTINIGTAQKQTLIQPGTYTVGFALSTGKTSTIKIEGGTNEAVTFDAVVPSGASNKDVGSYNFADTVGTDYPPSYRITPTCAEEKKFYLVATTFENVKTSVSNETRDGTYTQVVEVYPDDEISMDYGAVTGCREFDGSTYVIESANSCGGGAPDDMDDSKYTTMGDSDRSFRKVSDSFVFTDELRQKLGIEYGSYAYIWPYVQRKPSCTNSLPAAEEKTPCVEFSYVNRCHVGVGNSGTGNYNCSPSTAWNVVGSAIISDMSPGGKVFTSPGNSISCERSCLMSNVSTTEVCGTDIAARQTIFLRDKYSSDTTCPNDMHNTLHCNGTVSDSTFSCNVSCSSNIHFFDIKYYLKTASGATAYEKTSNESMPDLASYVDRMEADGVKNIKRN